MRCKFQRSTEIKVSITLYMAIVEKQNRGDINLNQISLRNIPGRL